MMVSEQPNIEELRRINPNIPIAVRTLTTGGFILKSTDRKPGYTLFHVSRYDEFGNVQFYCFALAENELNESQVNGATIAANHYKAKLVIIGRSPVQTPQVEWENFINLFGGPVLDTSPLESNFGNDLIELGHNQLPEGLQGEADDLFEIYVHSALQFILGGRVIRYGQARLFEAKPDGLAIPKPDFTALYDTKAYGKGYDVTSETMRQFNSYVEDYNSRYSNFYRLNSLIVISGEFPHKESTLIERSQELLAKCGTPLSFLDTSTLVQIIKMLREQPLFRRSINWARIFTRAKVKAEHVHSELLVIQKDGVVWRQ
jgi:hypothetical protein